MKITFTGRVLGWFESDLRLIRSSLRAQPNGLWSYPETGIGHPLFFRLPHPLHPLETIAAIRGGMGGIESDRSGEQFHSDRELALAMVARHDGWLALTAHIAGKLFLPAATIRLLWHALTPMHVPETPDFDTFQTVWDARCALYDAVGSDWGPDVVCEKNGPLRPNFWTEETNGEIEL